MAMSDSLVGLGFSAQQADAIGLNPNTLTCTGTSQSTAAKIKTNNTELSAASSQTGATFQDNEQVGDPFYLICTSSTAAVVYVPNGHALNTVVNDSLTLAQKAAAILIQYKKGFWSSVKSA